MVTQMDNQRIKSIEAIEELKRKLAFEKQRLQILQDQNALSQKNYMVNLKMLKNKKKWFKEISHPVELVNQLMNKRAPLSTTRLSRNRLTIHVKDESCLQLLSLPTCLLACQPACLLAIHFIWILLLVYYIGTLLLPHFIKWQQNRLKWKKFSHWILKILSFLDLAKAVWPSMNECVRVLRMKNRITALSNKRSSFLNHLKECCLVETREGEFSENLSFVVEEDCGDSRNTVSCWYLAIAWVIRLDLSDDPSIGGLDFSFEKTG